MEQKKCTQNIGGKTERDASTLVIVIEQGVRERTNASNSATVVVTVYSVHVDSLCTSQFTAYYSRKTALWIQKRI